ncbi:hypothetical protein OOK39_17345 [Streptomyces sp. NBC_00264]|uniref:hypothetical protein n=1 Tax=unclassified Streptomyces TaxID=2593676 RepID=UPI0022523E5C|nr:MULTISPECIES: hypothetical protein [unclassified Streptomyces]MCX4395864.1 hypothetical protein [Streptomyces sp. NBC_01767]MCX5101504.1 hypothetical protein [Streptomyces sp. NBC_00439]MCX5161028.1 hypothetical protein [Streptomyces sp. NBC_00305]MCX5219551.1 hypothetical protein [Streptomyces sp. NBC_00264]WSC33349.1 hypothetical protein OG902_23720 [Streptomyces sp. NBC_01768]
MAFSADELRVLRRALAIALHPMPLPDEDVQDCLRLAGAVDEAVGEAGRLRAFLLADLVRYRNALPGSVSGYLELLQDALAGGYDPGPDDLAALRALRHRPVAAALLERCQVLAERSVRARLAGRAVPAKAPAPRSRLLALPGGRAAEAEPERPKAPAEPARPTRPAGRPAPKPSEVFPPRRRPVPPPQQRAAG